MKLTWLTKGPFMSLRSQQLFKRYEANALSFFLGGVRCYPLVIGREQCAHYFPFFPVEHELPRFDPPIGFFFCFFFGCDDEPDKTSIVIF
jgi:hypothetical protein